MRDYSSLATFRIEKAQDRSKVLLEQIRRLESDVYASPASGLLLKFVKDCAVTLTEFLRNEHSLAVSRLLKPEETEIRVQRATKVIPLLHAILGFLAGSQINETPSQLVLALRRYVCDSLPGSDIIVSSKPELNYSITEIASRLKGLFRGTPMEASCSQLPSYLFVVTLPAVEREQVLLHGIVSHELGHPLSKQHQIPAKILRNLPPREDLIKQHVQKVSAQSSREPGITALPPPLVELLIRSHVTTEVNERVARWLRELCSDAIGVRLFGPAYYFAFAHFFLSFAHLDRASRTHPPARLRLRLMGRVLAQKYSFDRPEEKEMEEFFRVFSAVTSKKVVCRDPYDQIAVDHLEDDAVLGLICKEADACLSTLKCYSQEDHRKDIRELAPLLINLIPPGETGPLGKENGVSIVSILNAGWFVYLCKFSVFTNNLHKSEREELLATDRLQRILLKALEITETRTKWQEATRDLGRKTD